MKVALFITCLTDTFYPRVGEAVVRLLRHFGCQVEFPAEQTCCGQPAFNSGFHAEAAAVARRMTRIFAPYDVVVTPSASCAGMVKHHFPALLLEHGGDPGGAAGKLARNTHEFCSFLTHELRIDVSTLLRFSEPITFHYPCHARGIYTIDELRGWLAGVPNVDLRVPKHADLCCGFGGMFAVDHAEISGAMLDDKLAELIAAGANLVICNEGGCALNMSGAAHRKGLSLRFKHLAECLAESLGLMEPIA